MKPIIQFMIILFCIGFVACNKKNDLGGKGSLRGRLGYVDPSTGNTTVKILGGRFVKISYSASDTLNYLYSVATDTAGYFSFGNLDEKKQYDIFFEDSISGVLYSAFVTRQPNNDTISLIALPNNAKQNGIFLTTNDNVGGSLPNLSVAVYASRTLFVDDSINNSTAKKSFDILTNAAGIGTKYNIASGRYYLKATYQLTNQKLMASNYIDVGQKGLSTIALNLKPEPSFSSKIDFFTRDSQLTPLGNTSIYLYVSRVTFKSDSTGIYAIDSLKSDKYGMATRINLPVNKYFVMASTTIAGKKLTALDSFIIVTNAVVKDSLTLR